MAKFIIVKELMKYIKRYGLQGRTLEFKIKPVQGEPVSWVRDAIREIIEYSTTNLSPQDKIGFTFCSKEFSRGEGWVPFKQVSEVSLDDIWKMIYGIYQSNSAGFNTETFCLGVTSVKAVAGKGRGEKYNNFEEECARRKGIVVIKNKDNLCLPRALTVAVAHVTKDPQYKEVGRDIRKEQTKRAAALIEAAGVSVPVEGCGLPELKKFQKYLTEYQICVYQYGNKGRDVIFKGSPAEKSLNLLYHEGHYNVITSLTAAFCCDYYCTECNVPYNDKKDHRCQATCPGCRTSPPCKIGGRVECPACNRWFRSHTCFDNHKKTVCETVKGCTTCFKTVRSDRVHVCGEMFCHTCKKHQPGDHLCYMQVDNKIPSVKDTLFIFYDLETRQEKLQSDGSLLHEPNLCVFKQCCDSCIETDKIVCSKCGLRLQKLNCDDPITPFIHHIFTLRKQFKNVIVIGHNAGGFDHQFLLRYILTETDLTPELLTRGTRLILMQLQNVKFLDSLNYFPMALSKLPKAFGLKELKKGYFPHLFNTVANQNYVGPLPSVEFYSPDTMKGTDDEHDDDRKIFLRWYEDHKSDHFDFQKEIIDYCVSDVEILTQACLKFRKLMIEQGNVCPFTEATTLPSACNKIFRRNFLKPNTIGLIPKGGYRCRDNQSQIATQWLIWEERQRGIEIVQAAKQREAVVGGYKVDGFYKNTVFEFHGCYFHGCTRCFPYNRNSPLHGDKSLTLTTRYEQTCAKINRLKSLGYDVVEMWECDFKHFLSSNEEAADYLKNHSLVKVPPLNPRDAFFGGRTGNTCEHYKARQNETIKYVDVCSLYPYVNKYGKYPIGHPEVILGDECLKLNLKETEGIIKCRILPPRNLFHPVLPLKMNDKLMFVLCRTCGEKMCKNECVHTDDERVLEGTWVMDEVLKAMEKGYEMIQIYEVWKYQIEQYDPVTKAGGLFSEYISKFLKIKQQASGWPSDIDKHSYVSEYLNKEGVVLNPDEIELNPGLRQLGKALITSFWGKLGQRENLCKTAIVRTPEEFHKMMYDPAIVVNTIKPVNENVLVVNWEYIQESYDILPTVNVALAAYTTAQARLKLYSYLEKLDDRVLYYDTDSIIYFSKPGEYEVPIGSFLGEMTDELECYGVGSYIVEFVSGGPKNYAYQVHSPTKNEYFVTCKVKGISLNYKTSILINMDAIKKMVLEKQDPIPITTTHIRRTTDFNVVSKEEVKTYKPTSSKRVFSEDHTSTPYGYIKKRKM